MFFAFFVWVISPAASLKCYQCTVTLDHNGNEAGVANPDCWTDNVDSKYEAECFAGKLTLVISLLRLNFIIRWTTLSRCKV